MVLNLVVPDISNNLFPNLTTLISHIIATAIILTVMVKLVWKPFKKSQENQTNYIQDNIKESELNKIQAAANKTASEKDLEDARLQAKIIIDDSKIKSLELSEKIIADAKEEAARIMVDAQLEIHKERINMATEVRKEIVEVAMLAAEKVIERNVDNNDNRKIVKEFVSTYEKSKKVGD